MVDTIYGGDIKPINFDDGLNFLGHNLLTTELTSLRGLVR